MILHESVPRLKKEKQSRIFPFVWDSNVYVEYDRCYDFGASNYRLNISG